MSTFEFASGSFRADETFSRRRPEIRSRRVAGASFRSSDSGGGPVPPTVLQENVYRPSFTDRFVSTFGLDTLGLSRRDTVFTEDEYELIDEAQAEVASKKAPKTAAKSREDLEALDKIMAGIGSGPEEDYLARLNRLITKYKIQTPKIQVEYRELNISTQALVGSAAVPTVGSSFINLAKSLVLLKPKTKAHMILKNLSGVVPPGRITLLLGPPGCGKSSLLKMLAGRITDGGALNVTGSVKYNGHNLDEFEVVRTAAYVGQLDNHIAALSVLDTLEFAHVCQHGFRPEKYNLINQIQEAVIKAGFDVHQSSRIASSRRGRDSRSEEPGGPEDPAIDIAGFDEPDIKQKGVVGIGINAKSQRTQDAIAAAAKFGSDEQEFMELLGEVKHTRGLTVMSTMRCLGIAHTKDTPVGDASLRGVSGGERKRVTLAEMLVGGRGALFLDEISTGLDSATLFNVISTLGRVTRTMGLCTVISLLQPPPEVYNLYDDLILMSQGYIVWHGPVDEVVPFFTSLGFVCPPRKDVPSFLQEVTTESGQLEYASVSLLEERGFDETTIRTRTFFEGRKRYVVPTEEVVQAFWQCPAGLRMKKQLMRPFDKSRCHPAALKQGKYALSSWEAVKVVTARQMLLTIKDAGLLRGRLAQTIIIGLIVGGLYYQLPEGETSSARNFFGSSFLLVMFASMSGMPQLVVGMLTKGVWFKHRDNLFYPAWVHSLAMTLVAVPPQAIDTFFWCIVTYFMIGFYYGVGYWFTFYCVLFCVALSFGAMFRSLAHLSPDGIAANNMGALLLLVVVVMSGFTIVRTSVPDWWIWAYWISPYSWGMRSLVINEFTAPPWRTPDPSNPGQTIGDTALESFAFYTDRFWIWCGVGYLLGFVLMCVGISAFALHYFSGPKKIAAIPDEEELEKARLAALERKRALASSLEHQGRTEEAAATQLGSRVNPAASMRRIITFSSRRDVGSERVGDVGSERSSLRSGPESTASNVMGRHGAAHVVSSRRSNAGVDGATAGDVVINVSPGEGAGQGASIPFTPTSLVWRDMRYFVPNPSYKNGKDDIPEKLELLKGITGFAEPGTLTALMGGSGAGKTTLMDCIAGRKTIGEITGDIMVNGHPKDQATLSRVMGYVEQMDIHTPAQTVIEALLFSARLRLPGSTSMEKVKAYVDEVVDLVDLTEIMFNLVGVPGQTGLSVEQRKRLTIANEMVSNPSVMFMDEPTSGLDARAAAIVMRAVRNIGNSNRAVLVTIHQPSIEIFEAFDNLLLLQRGGRITYFGALGDESCNLISYLQAVPGCSPIKPGSNPATWMLEVTGGAMAVSGAKAVQVVWPDLYQQSELAGNNAAYADHLVARDSNSMQPLVVEGGKYAASFGVQFRALMAKYMNAYWRTPSYNYIRYIITTIVALLYGSIYYKAAEVTNPMQFQHVQSVGGVIYLSVSFLGMANMMAVMPFVALERVVYYREQAASTYNPWAYGFVISMVELPYQLVQVIVFVCIMYPMLFFVRSAAHFFFYLLLSFLTLMFYVAFGMALVYITPTQQLAQVMGSGFNFLFNIFNGYVIAYPSIARGFKWVNRISPTTWVIYGLVVDQLGFRQEAVSGLPGDPQPPPTVSQFMETNYGYKYDFRFWTILILIAYVLFFRVLGVLALRYVSFLKR